MVGATAIGVQVLFLWKLRWICCWDLASRSACSVLKAYELMLNTSKVIDWAC